MKQVLVPTFDEAVADIPGGSTIMVGGFGPGTPRNLIAALARQGATGLTVVCNTPGDGSGRVDIHHLIRNGQVTKVICSFLVKDDPLNTPPSRSEWDRRTALELAPQGTLAERIRAGGAGIPAFYTAVGAGTELSHSKETRRFGQKTFLLEHALTADYAFVRAWKADRFGNLIYRLSQRNFNPLMAMAARCTIAEIEEPVLEQGAFDPDHIHTPGLFVQRVVQIPPPPAGIWEQPWTHLG